MPKAKRPAWWQVNGIVIGAALLLWWEAHARLTGALHQIVLVGIVILVFGLIAWWLEANQAELEEEEREREARARTRRIVAEVERDARAQVRARRAVAREAQRQQAQAERLRARQEAARDLSPTPVQAHFRQVMLAEKQPRT